MLAIDDFEDVLPLLKPRSSVVLHSACAEPGRLAGELAAHAGILRDIRVYTLMPMGDAPYAAPTIGSGLSVASFHPGKGLREAANAGRAELLRVSLSDIPGLFRARTLTADVLMLQLSPPDRSGVMSLGISIDYMRAVLAQRPTVVAEINPLMPRTCGDTLIHEDEVDFALAAHGPPVAVEAAKSAPIEQQIADNVAALVRHGAVVQTGIGSLPDLVLGRLGSLRDLGIHTGIIGDSLLPLIERGVVTNATKRRFRGKCVTTMAAGSQQFYAALDRNPAIEFHPCSITHAADVIAAIDGFCAINSVLQIDLAGRANAERIDGKVVAAPGGLPDFAHGAAIAKDGMSIIALRSASKDGTRSNIVPELPAGAPVTIGPDAIDYVVTEHGVARLRGLASTDRARALIAVAHPDFRADLRRSIMIPNARAHDAMSPLCDPCPGSR